MHNSDEINQQDEKFIDDEMQCTYKNAMHRNHTQKNAEALYRKGQMLTATDAKTGKTVKGRVFSVHRQLGGGWKYTIIIEAMNGYMLVFTEDKVKPA